MAEAQLRKRFLELLDKDLEFRYAVAGYLGISETLRHLDRIAEEQRKIWEEIARIKAEQGRIWEEIAALREEQRKTWEEIVELKKGQARIWDELMELRREQVRLRQDFNKMLEVISAIETRLSRVERTLDKLTLDIEEEAREVLSHRLREMGVDVKLERLELPGLEINLYGASEDTCVVGEATVRLGKSGVEELLRKAEDLARLYPEYVKPRKLLVIYTSLATREAVRAAEERGVWVLKATGDITRPSQL